MPQERIRMMECLGVGFLSLRRRLAARASGAFATVEWNVSGCRGASCYSNELGLVLALMLVLVLVLVTRTMWCTGGIDARFLSSPPSSPPRRSSYGPLSVIPSESNSGMLGNCTTTNPTRQRRARSERRKAAWSPSPSLHRVLLLPQKKQPATTAGPSSGSQFNSPTTSSFQLEFQVRELPGCDDHFKLCFCASASPPLPPRLPKTLSTTRPVPPLTAAAPATASLRRNATTSPAPENIDRCVVQTLRRTPIHVYWMSPSARRRP